MVACENERERDLYLLKTDGSAVRILDLLRKDNPQKGARGLEQRKGRSVIQRTRPSFVFILESDEQINMRPAQNHVYSKQPHSHQHAEMLVRAAESRQPYFRMR